MADTARVIHPEFAPGRRILAVSDIHGNLPFFQGLLKQVNFTPEDILVLDGDILEKGREPESVWHVVNVQKDRDPTLRDPVRFTDTDLQPLTEAHGRRSILAVRLDKAVNHYRESVRIRLRHTYRAL